MSVNIQLLNTGEDLSAAVLNRPLSQLKTALETLQGTVGVLTAGATVYRKGVPCDASVELGMVVYLDSTGIARPALARWSDVTGSQGEAKLADSAWPLGVVETITGGVASVVVSGELSDATAIMSLMGTSNPVAGVYFLSDTVAGDVTDTPPPLALRTVLVDSTGVVAVSLQKSPDGYHIHKSFDIETDSNWTEAGGLWTYSGSDIDDLASFGITDAVFMHTVTEEAGVRVVIDDTFQLVRNDDGTIKLTASADPSAFTNITAYTTFPFVTEQPVVRAISSNSPRLRATAVNGLVELTLDPDASMPVDAPSGTAVSELLPNGGYKTTPVVSSLTVGGNASIAKNLTTGAHAIAVGYAENHVLSPDIVSLDGTTVTYGASQLMYVFPPGRISKVTGSFSVATPPAGTQWRLYPYLEAAGVAGAFTGDFTITPVFSSVPGIGIEGDEEDEEDEVAVASSGTPLSLSIAVTNAKRRAKRTTTGIVATAPGMLYITVQPTTSPAESWKILRFGAVVTMEPLGTV